jgi:hypothetical protein
MNLKKKQFIRRLLFVVLIVGLFEQFNFTVLYIIVYPSRTSASYIFFIFVFGDWFLSASCLYMLIVEGIKEGHISSLEQMQVRAAISIQHLRTIHIKTTNLVEELNQVLGFLPLILLSFAFIMVPGELVNFTNSQFVAFNDSYSSISEWFLMEGFMSLSYFVFLLILYYFAESRQEHMKEINEEAIRTLGHSRQTFLLLDMTRKRNYTFRAMLVKVNNSTILSFFGSLVSFSVLFLQIDENKSKMTIPRT